MRGIDGLFQATVLQPANAGAVIAMECRGMTDDLEELAVAALDVLVRVEAKYQSLNDKIRKLMGDFPTQLQPIDAEIDTSVMELINNIIGHDMLASYYRYECVGRFGHGGGIACCEPSQGEKAWKLHNVNDLRKYLDHAKVCPGINRNVDRTDASPTGTSA